MGRYGLSRIQLSHAGFNPLKHPWEALGRVDFPRGVKVLMRGLSPTINPNLRYCQTCIHGSINTRSLPLSEIAHPVKLHMCQHVKLFGKRNVSKTLASTRVLSFQERDLSGATLYSFPTHVCACFCKQEYVVRVILYFVNNIEMPFNGIV